MNILTTSNNDIIKLIKGHINLFDSFEHLYLFGSSLDSNVISNDIDLLVIYTEYSNKIANDLELIIDELEKVSGFPIDLTVLSIEEEKDTEFLEKIKSHYLKLK